MRKIKEVLRLNFEVGLGLRQIARSCSIGLGTAHEYLQRAEAAKVTWPLGPEWDDHRLETALFGGPPRSRPTVLPMPDFAELHRERQQHPHLTQQLLWEEYRQANPDGYQYSRFCELYQRWRRKLDVVLRQEHKTGEKLFVDWAGTTVPIHDPRGGPVQQAHLFLAVLGATQFAEVDKRALSPLPTERFDLSEWSRARVNIDYHIAFDTNYYSVPYNLVHELVEVRSTPTIEIFHKSQRVASHLRAHGHGHAITIAEHRPRSHQAHLEWTPSRMVHGRRPLPRTLLGCSSAFLQTSRIRRWATDLALASSGSLISTRRFAWKPQRSGRCSRERAAIKA